MTTLQTLRQEQSPVGDDGLAGLSGLTGLRSLNVEGTGATADAVKKLAADLPQREIQWDGGAIGPKK